MHSVRRVEPSIWNKNVCKSVLLELFKMLQKCETQTNTLHYWYLWSEVPQNQPATGPGRAVGTPCGTCCVEEDREEKKDRNKEIIIKCIL